MTIMESKNILSKSTDWGTGEYCSAVENLKDFYIAIGRYFHSRVNSPDEEHDSTIKAAARYVGRTGDKDFVHELELEIRRHLLVPSDTAPEAQLDSAVTPEQ